MLHTVHMAERMESLAEQIGPEDEAASLLFDGAQEIRRLTTVLTDAHNTHRHTLSAEIEAASNKFFSQMNALPLLRRKLG